VRPVPRLHAITDDARLADARFVTDAAAVLEAGGADVALHLRGRKTTTRRLHELALALLPIARAAGAKLIVNDRVDVARAVGVDGVQLREDSLDVSHARAILGAGALVGVSRHADSSLRAEDADFVVFGAIYPTRSHPGRAPAGLAAVRLGASGVRRQATETASRVIAIGGITPSRVPQVMKAGAYGVAALSGIWEGGAGVVVEYVLALNRQLADG
jgi:thiamine-phosphate pyrophosphorylase